MSHRHTEIGPKISLPITPMLDMTFQLLFFFVMNFNPADLEGQMDMALPAVETVRQQPIGGEKNAEPGFAFDVTVVVRATLDGGAISAIFVRKVQGKDELVNGLDGLGRYLEEMSARGEAKQKITILGDSKLRIKHLMKVMDVCRAAGFQSTSLVKPDEIGR